MKLHEQIKNTSTSQHTSSSDFRITTSAKAFKILSDGIYSDKIRAIIRELSTNAQDSHIEAGNKNPFDVHLPNHSEPWFSVRDYGTGMTKEKIENLYTTYFDSDRNNSDDFTGALGLGSKSPFSYTDNFTIESNVDGQKLIYSCYIDSFGTPKVGLLTELKTQDANGVEIKFSVLATDFSNFEKKAEDVFYPFEVKPNIVNGVINFQEKKILEEGNDWQIVGNRDNTNRALAIMGNVAYPISTSSFESELTMEEISLLRSTIDISFNIGELDVSASRESLSYDQTTIKNIKDKTSKIVEEITEIVQKKVNKAKNYWDAISILYKYNKEVRGLKVGSVVPVVWYRNSKIKNGTGYSFRLPKYKKDFIQYYQRYDGIKREKLLGYISLSFGSIPIVVVNDEKSKTSGFRKARTFLKNNEFYSNVLVVDSSDWLKKYKKQWNNIHVKYSSKLPKPKYNNKKTNNSTKVKTFFDLTTLSWKTIYKDDVDLSKPHFYIEMKNKTAVYCDESGEIKKISDFQKYRDFVKEFGFLGDLRIYGIRTVDLKSKDFKDCNFVNIYEFVSSNINEVYRKHKHLFQRYFTVSSNRSMANRWTWFFSSEVAEHIHVENSYYFKLFNFIKYYRKVEKFLENKEVYNKISVISQFDDMINEDKYEMRKFDNLIENFYEKYPLLKKAIRFEKDEAVDYINAMDILRSQ